MMDEDLLDVCVEFYCVLYCRLILHIPPGTCNYL